jgi:hypothetical protein
MDWLARRSKRSNEAAVHGHVAELARWHRAHRGKLEAKGCQTVLTEASRDEEVGAVIIFTAPLRQGHLIAWNSGWIEAFVFRAEDKEALLNGSAPPDDDESLDALLDSIVELLLA